MPRCSDMTDTAHSTAFNLPPGDKAAIFLDFDGTLVDLAPTPDAIHIPDDLTDLLDALLEFTSGATALVSGRAAGDLARHLSSFQGVIVGGHGAEWRNGNGVEPRVDVNFDHLDRMVRTARAFEQAHRGTLVETKPTGLVLHYRANPDLAGVVTEFAGRLAQDHDGFEHHPAKMAIEVRPEGVGKDAALLDLMALDPFEGRTPVMFGDDTTDEPALHWAQSQGGLGIKVGEGDSVARHRLSAPTDVRQFLRRWL